MEPTTPIKKGSLSTNNKTPQLPPAPRKPAPTGRLTHVSTSIKMKVPNPITPIRNSDEPDETFDKPPPAARKPAPSARLYNAALKSVTERILKDFGHRVTLDALKRWSSLLDCKDVAKGVEAVTFTVPKIADNEREQYYDTFTKIFVKMPNLRDIKIRGSQKIAETVDIGVDHEVLAFFFNAQKNSLCFVDLDDVLCCNGPWSMILPSLQRTSLSMAHFTNLRASPNPKYCMFWGKERQTHSVWNAATKGLEYVVVERSQAAMTGKEAVKAGIELMLEGSRWVKVD
ncbi:hypothetical protein CLAFUW4_13584 [Fulvia fulva]|uniref:Uncharacterized protein n=1 Tax=Passalora fulva TaxID=5499 RepID=A0A9Q8UW80_PASFU|nr:uncharacterized protein CLAFUR5_13435 [Fulvia fulva]KAK4610298.1 hypothetical protein CLAFUR4_13587 [Fulvia fulva]KAK4611134.1 hypothetical protein CLAFUR0_13594 [Fulvia fulva]UJO24627.1 hypothetical protein CLAFUR5_13435 [Fulvia fulva]WPV22095.1 hypothetical protein CLAFUW4_13584 [Fulvia fulva]WPV37080.1 hypothetical protein CLAFUW7_13592 [Fulvia fulva]